MMDLMTMKPVGDAEFKLIRRLIYEEAGIHIKDSKKTMVANRLRKRLESHGIDSYKAYYDYLTKSPDGKQELSEFINCLTTNETFFFRHSEQIDYLVETLMPRLSASRAGRIRIWSAACSSGEEPYSIVIRLLDDKKSNLIDRVDIIGSDINQSMINSAKAGFYKYYAVQRMPESLCKRYFEKNEDGLFLLSGMIRNHVHFYQANLLEPFSHGRFDVIFCRNVMIYFDKSSKNTVLENLYENLKPGGFLITGYAESLLNNKTHFKYIKPTIYQKTE